MASADGRIACPKCGANNFDTVTVCWKCNNVHGYFNSQRFGFEFDGEAPVSQFAQLLLVEVRKVNDCGDSNFESAKSLLHRFNHQPKPRLGTAFPQLLQAFQMQVQRLARMPERFVQRLSAGDDVGDVREVYDIGRIPRLISHGEHVAAILMCGLHGPAPSRDAECRQDGRSSVRRVVSRWSTRDHRLDGTCNGCPAG